MNVAFELESQSKILLVLHQWANCSTEHLRCSRSYFYRNWFVARWEQQDCYQNL